jgi:hypothetical protein
MMTIGPALLLLAAFDNLRGRWARWLITYGRVPFFFYVTHLYLIHGLALAFALAMNPAHSSRPLSPEIPAVVLSLANVYFVWLFVLILLYPLCRWFAELKQRRTEWWWSYL